MNKKVAVIIAGGKSSRMKRDKALLPFGGFSTLTEYQYKRLSPFFDEVYISAKSNKFNFSVDIIEDIYEVSSPLVAIVSIFKTLDADEVFILSVDSPFVSLNTIKDIYEESKISNSDVILAKSTNGVEPLCAIYRKSVLPLAEEKLSQNRHRLQSFLDGLECSTIEFESSRDFINLNYPQDYQDASIVDSL